MMGFSIDILMQTIKPLSTNVASLSLFVRAVRRVTLYFALSAVVR